MRAMISNNCALRARVPFPRVEFTSVSIHRERRLMPYPADQLFDLVADVESYPKFLPWCTAARVISREARGEIGTPVQKTQ